MTDRPEQDNTAVFYFLGVEEDDCYREWDNDGWWCLNDHTACLWNDGNNTCNHPGHDAQPLENPTEVQT